MNNNGTTSPAVIVDKNGRTTTVHRKVEARQSSTPDRFPKPQIMASGVPEGSRTPLDLPEPISDPEKLKSYRWFLTHDLISSRKTVNAEEAALIRKIISDGHTSPEVLSQVTGYMGMFSAGERVPHYDYNMLLIMDYICREEGSGFIPADRTHVFTNAVEGLGIRRRAEDTHTIPPLTTVEALESHAAVVRMLLLADAKGMDQGVVIEKEHRTVEGHRFHGVSFRNHGFRALLNERPKDYREIERYVLDRGIPKNKAGVEALRSYLDDEETQSAIADGWL